MTSQPTRIRSFLFLLSLPVFVSLLAGCGGGKMLLTGQNEPDSAVEWIFDAGHELALAWHLYPWITSAWITGGGVHGERVIILCNLGGATEVLMPSHAYVVDINSGKVVSSIPGPTRAYHLDWLITPDRAYFKCQGREERLAFDLTRGRVDWAPPQPQETVQVQSHPMPYKEVELNAVSGLRRYEFDLGHGRRLLTAFTPGLFPSETYDLSWYEAGTWHTRRLCRLPKRPYTMGEELFIHDDRRLLFSLGCFLICVDTRKLPRCSAESEPAVSRVSPGGISVGRKVSASCVLAHQLYPANRVIFEILASQVLEEASRYPWSSAFSGIASMGQRSVQSNRSKVEQKGLP